jgi:anti-sigma factor RsiW
MSYLDGELTEAQAAPLRKHLLGCQPCRASAQDQKNLKRWFGATEAVAVPRDFAARVARRAFQGDRGERFTAAPAALPAARRNEVDEQRSLRFVLTLTALAAAVVIFLSVAIRQMTLPVGDNLRADDQTNVIPLERCIEQLDRLNAHEAQVAPVNASNGPGAPGTSASVEGKRP